MALLEPSHSILPQRTASDKAHRWLDRWQVFRNNRPIQGVPPCRCTLQQESLQQAFHSAMSILGKIPGDKEIVLTGRARVGGTYCWGYR